MGQNVRNQSFGIIRIKNDSANHQHQGIALSSGFPVLKASGDEMAGLATIKNAYLFINNGLMADSLKVKLDIKKEEQIAPLFNYEF